VISERRPQGILLKPYNHSKRVFFGFKSSFQHSFWNFLSTSGLSQICKIWNAWKLHSLFSRNTLIPSSEKTSWSLKTSFWKKNCPKIIQRRLWKISELHGFRISKQEAPKPWKPLRGGKFFMNFCICWTIFFQNVVLKS
jgi:hypothetical protein